MGFSRHLQTLCICLALFATHVCADEVEFVVSGIEEPMLTNVQNHVSGYRIGSGAKLNSRLRRKLLEEAKTSAVSAMRPFGYFHPEVSTDIHAKDAGHWQLNVRVIAGPPVLVQNLELELTGPGKELPSLKSWYESFPVKQGDVLNQPAWDKTKSDVIRLLEEAGYLKAQFSRHEIRVDPKSNTARLALLLDTGPQAMMGQVTFQQDVMSDAVLASVQRFQQGDAYSAWLLEKFRLDLWRTGYFEDIELVERRDLAAIPPRVDLEVNFSPRKKDTYQGTLGFGTDTLIRLQFLWGRHLQNRRGDNFDIGFGWQQKNNEFTLQANYRIPRETNPQQFWMTSFGLKSEQQSLNASVSGDIEDRITIARGTLNDLSLRFGKTRARNMKGGFEQFFETVYVQYLNENHDFSLTDRVDPDTEFSTNQGIGSDLLNNTSNSFSIGMNWDWPQIYGSGFETTGHHERAWIFTSNQVWGSDADYSQLYLSSRMNFLAGKHWKFLLRAEAGYSDARTADVSVSTQEGVVEFALTELPYLYRFKAGGSNSVRGYAFEILDNNGIGSNNVFTASAEVEYHFHDKWSVAAFADVGNAFNDWSNPDLKLGTGFGIRWYTLIGALRLDLAQGWDLAGDPWRIHLTIGTPLL